MDPFLLILNLPYNALKVPHIRLNVPSFSLPSAIIVFSLVLVTNFLVVSGYIYDASSNHWALGSLMILSQECKIYGFSLQKSERAIYYRRSLIGVYVLAWWGGDIFVGLRPRQT